MLTPVVFAITTIADGSHTITQSSAATLEPALLYAVQWTDGDLADGVDAVLSVVDRITGVETTLLTLTNANDDAVYYPRVDAHSTAGAALAEGADLTAERACMIVNGPLKLAVTNGGDTKTGVTVVYLKCG